MKLKKFVRFVDSYLGVNNFTIYITHSSTVSRVHLHFGDEKLLVEGDSLDSLFKKMCIFLIETTPPCFEYSND